jgi:hypothetical protein
LRKKRKRVENLQRIEGEEVKKILVAMIDAFEKVRNEKDFLQALVEIIAYEKTMDVLMEMVKEEYRKPVFELYRSIIKAAKKAVMGW